MQIGNSTPLSSEYLRMLNLNRDQAGELSLDPNASTQKNGRAENKISRQPAYEPLASNLHI